MKQNMIFLIKKSEDVGKSILLIIKPLLNYLVIFIKILKNTIQVKNEKH